MVTCTPVHPEGPRYGASIVYLSGLWVGPQVWLHTATYLAHRGWAGALVDTRAVRGGIAGRAQAVAEHLRTLVAPPIVVGHDAGALVALAAAARAPVRALVLVSPLLPGTPTTHALTWSRGLVWSLLRRRAVGPPVGRLGEAFLGEVPAGIRATVTAEDPRLLADLARRRTIVRPSAMPPTLVLRGARDPLLSRADAADLARQLAADHDELPGGHWLTTAPAARECVHRAHRWLVQRLGEPLLELYAEAMAEREDGTIED